MTPLAPVHELQAHILRLAIIADPPYVAYCRALVGRRVLDRPRTSSTSATSPSDTSTAGEAVGGGKCFRLGLVEAYNRHTGAHRIRYTDARAAKKVDDDKTYCPSVTGNYGAHVKFVY